MKMTVRQITRISIVAAVYAAVTMALAPLSYGNIQLRISEVLTILPFFFPETAIGLTVGCAIANTLSMYGIIDVVFGSLATFLAGITMAYLGKKGRDSVLCKIVACFQPVLFNGVIIGAVIAYTTAAEGAFMTALIINGLQVAVGELIVLYAVGLPAMMYLPKTAVFKKLSENIY